MHRLAIALTLSLVAVPALAAVRDDLSASAAAFVLEEVEGATAERQAAIAACLVAAFDGLDDATVETMLSEDDFEDSLDALIDAYPEREDHVETCEEL